MTDDRAEQIELARNLLKHVRHAAYATINENGTPHNSPLKFIRDDKLTKLYIGSFSESIHVKNLLRTGQAFVVLYDSFAKGQGGVYITAINGHECVDDELIEALDIHNRVREEQGSRPIEISYYRKDKPAQKMYCFDVSRIEVYSLKRGQDGHIAFEQRAEVDAVDLL